MNKKHLQILSEGKNLIEGRDRVILFLSDGEPSDIPMEIFTAIHHGNRKVGNTALLLTYALGRGNFGILLNRMAQQSFSFEESKEKKLKDPPIGKFFQVCHLFHFVYLNIIANSKQIFKIQKR